MKQIDNGKENVFDCFGRLDIVFPKTEDGLRKSPDRCLKCYRKTECLRCAVKSLSGLKLKGENVDRAYKSGVIGFWERWSKKKYLHCKAADRKKSL